MDDVTSGVAKIVCGVPLGSFLKYHGIGYHIYADDTQLYISFMCNNHLSKLNHCISDIRVWMINNNDSKTELMVFFSTDEARF